MTEFDKLAPDFIALQAELAPLEKSAVNPFFKSKYAPLPEVRAAMRPLLAKHNFGLSVVPKVIDGQNGLRFLLIHSSGQVIEGEWKLNPVKSDPQGEGADTTYKRRFGEMAITGLVAEEDDDGNSASFRPAPAAGKAPVRGPKSEADVKRDELRKYAAENNYDLKRIADKFADTTTVNGKGADLKTATAEQVEAFLTSLEAGVVVL